jgi:teichuronic acid biosynthesis glycosyltransferase TuaC
MRILMATNMYPYPDAPWYGIFVRELVEALRAQGLEVDVALQLGRVSRWNYLRGIFAMRRMLRARHYDIIHSHHTYSTIVAWLARLLASSRVPIVWTFHDSEIFRRTTVYEQDFIERLKYSLAIKRWAIRRVDFMIPVQRQMLPTVLGTDEAARIPARVIPAGIDLSRFENIDRAAARARLKHPEDKKIIFFPSAATKPEKRYDLAVAAVNLLLAENYPLYLYGAGNIPYAEMPLHLAAADVVVVCSDYEASPLVVREAFACETPVVATPAGDIPEYKELPGLFICDWTANSIAAGIKQALAAPRPYGGLELNRRLGLDQTQIAEKNVEVYRLVTGKKPR